MKKTTLILAGIALIAASCAKTEVVSSGPDGAEKGISFSAYTARPTKAQEDVTTDNLTSFQATAIGNTAIYFDNVRFSKNSDTPAVWESSPAYFWPAYPLHFYAYNTPTKGIFTRDFDPLSQTITFSPSTNLSEQEDLVAAYAGSKSESDATPTNNSLALTFNHYLTQIVVKAKNSNTAYTVEVSGVKIAHMKNKVKYTFSSNNAVVADDADDATYSSEFTDNAKTLDGTAKEVMTANTDNKWYLVPQTVTAWNQATDKKNNSTKTYIALKVKITDPTNAAVYPISGTGSAWMAVPVPASQVFQPGHKYTFVINFFQKNGAGFVDPENPSDIDGDGDADDDDKGMPIIGGPIQFSANVNTWPDETVITIDL